MTLRFLFQMREVLWYSLHFYVYWRCT